jgi:hypothetical protein
MLLLLACAPSEPAYVERADLDRAVARSDFGALCAGLKMEDEGVRTEAAEKLVRFPAAKIGCLCERMVRNGAWDAAVLSGMSKVKDDEHVGCAAKLLDDPAQKDRAGLAAALRKIKAPAVRARLVAAAKAEPDAEVRASALAALAGTDDAGEKAALVAALSDPSAAIRAAGAAALQGEKEPAVLALVATDPDAGVRAGALTGSRGADGWSAAACDRLLHDTDPLVRAQAATLMKGTRAPEEWACLRERAFTQEDDAGVRLALLQSLSKTSAPAASDVLCEVIPFWVKTYVGDAQVQRDSDLDVIHWQNERDFNRSYDCVAAAQKKAGAYTCWGKGYVADQFREFGGKVGVPKCAGGGGVVYSNEVTF